LSQLHIARDGSVTIVAVGVAWHADLRFVLDGDMYSTTTTTDDTLLHLGYEALTALELDLPFANPHIPRPDVLSAGPAVG
jgi:hypothetical protein